MNVKCEIREGVGIVAIEGPLTAATAEDFRRAFWAWYPQAGCRRVILDLGAMDVLDSTGLGTFVAALKFVAEQGGDIRIARLQKKPRLVFEITRSHRIFEILDTVEEALRVSK